MKVTEINISLRNEDKLKALMQPENLLRKGFTMKDIRENL